MEKLSKKSKNQKNAKKQLSNDNIYLAWRYDEMDTWFITYPTTELKFKFPVLKKLRLECEISNGPVFIQNNEPTIGDIIVNEDGKFLLIKKIDLS